MKKKHISMLLLWVLGVAIPLAAIITLVAAKPSNYEPNIPKGPNIPIEPNMPKDPNSGKPNKAAFQPQDNIFRLICDCGFVRI